MLADTKSEDGSAVTQTEFVAREFETTVTDSDRKRLVEAIETAISNLRSQIDDDTLERLLRGESGHKTLKTEDTDDRLAPEAFTRKAVLDVLFEALGYDDLLPEPAIVGNPPREIGDYSMHFDMEDGTDRLLIEAEPLGKPLDSRNHGIEQVKGWLRLRGSHSNYGFATNGLHWVFVRYDEIKYESHIIQDVDLRPVFLTMFETFAIGDGSATDALSEVGYEAVDQLIRTFARDNFVSIATDADEKVPKLQEEITDDFYDDYVRYVFGITDDEDDDRAARSLIGKGIIAPDGATGDDVRLFAVGLMNRLLFVKFLEDRGLVRENLLRTLRETHDKGRYPKSLYETFLEPLFYDVFDARSAERTDRIRSIDLFAEIPYLNGGLFRPLMSEEAAFDETAMDVRDTVLKDIIDLLETYEFSASGDVTTLDPSVLGNVFEKTINYLTTGAGDQNKELGAYYTPDEITHFCAKQTVGPGLRDRFAERLVADYGWTEEMVEKYDDIDELLDALPPNTDLADDLLDEVGSFRVLDPAVGSGHFLTSAMGEIVSIRKSLYDLHGDGPDEWAVRKETVVENLYGVDILEPAVEIAKLRLWLSIIAEVDPEAVSEYDEDDLTLPNVVFNVRQGNSLIGFTGLLETKTDGEGDGKQTVLDSWGPDSVRAKYGSIITKVTDHKRTADSDEAIEHLHEAEALLGDYRKDLDEKVLEEFTEAGIEDVTLDRVRNYDPFHWVLEFAEVYGDGGFDVIVGNPPWNLLTANRDVFFSRYDPTFRSHTSSKKDAIQDYLCGNDAVEAAWQDYQEDMKFQARYFNNSPAYTLQSPKVDGRHVASENDLSALFLERVFDITRDDGLVSLILPGNIFNGAASKDLRMEMLDESRIRSIVGFVNKGIFKEIHKQYQFGVVTFENSGRTDELNGIFRQQDLNVLNDINERTADIPRRVLAEYSPKARIFPYIASQIEVELLDAVLRHPSLEEEGNWQAIPVTKELHEPSDKHLFVSSESEGEYPIYDGGSIHQYHYDNSLDGDIESPRYWGVESESVEISAKRRVQEKKLNSYDLIRAIYSAFDGEDSSKSKGDFVDDLLRTHRGNELELDDIRLDCTTYRIAYRDVTNATNERTMIAAVLPPDVLCLHTLQTLKPSKVEPQESDLSEYPLHNAYKRMFTDRELFLIVGLLNSVPFDFLMRTKVDTHIVKYKLEESQLPRFTDGDDWFEYIWTRAARLNCYGEAFAEMRQRLGGIEPATEMDERRRLQAEIDAAAFHAYGLDRAETKFVLDDFHRVENNPRMMTEAYFDSVLDYYDDLAEREPFGNSHHIPAEKIK